MIHLSGLKKVLSNRPILRGLDLTVYKGETFVIIGYSGTGKSVTIRHITGLMYADEGSVSVFGRDVTKLPPAEYAELRKEMGVLFQSGALLNWMTVFDNVALPLREHTKMTETEIRERVMECLKHVNMQDAGHKFPSEISGGMKKRAGLARAIVFQPKLVLYDEPTSGLDPVMSNQVNELTNHMRDELGLTQVVVTHDMNAAYMIGNRIGMLYNGVMEQVGTPDDIKNSKSAVVQQFISGATKGPHQVV
ncbi:MAG: ATP-binding cassette domain-containing protein [Planctomycetes bacterium]|nr:ATP-binding cassette domain-containing protein [Planctomycetota bacterium]